MRSFEKKAAVIVLAAGQGLFLVRTAFCAAKTDAPALMQKAWLLFQRDHGYQEAISVYEELLAKYPKSAEAPDARLMIGLNYDWLAKAQDDPRLILKEREALLKLIEEHPDSPRVADAALYLGQTYSGFVGVYLPPEYLDYEQAIGFFRKAMKKSDRDWVKAQAQGRIGQCYQKMEDAGKAKEAFQAAAKNYPATPWAKEAKSLLGEIVGSRLPLLSAAQDLYEKTEDYDLALEVFQRVISRYPKTSSAQYAQMMVGLCYERMGKPDDAVKAFETYLSDYEPAKGDAVRYYLGEALLRTGRGQDALEHLTKALKDPDSPKWIVKAAQEAIDKIK